MIVLSEQDARFKYDVADEPGGDNIKLCFACGACTASCPVADIDPQFNPRKIIRMVLLGMRKEVLSSSVPWLCVQCYSCQAHCPQNVKFSDVVKALRSMAIREGYVHPSFVEQVKEVDVLCRRLRNQVVLSISAQKSAEGKVEPVELAERALNRIRS